jgi:hypothetical protein
VCGAIEYTASDLSRNQVFYALQVGALLEELAEVALCVLCVCMFIVIKA